MNFSAVQIIVILAKGGKAFVQKIMSFNRIRICFKEPYGVIAVSAPFAKRRTIAIEVSLTVFDTIKIFGIITC